MSSLSTFSTFQKTWLARSQIAQDEGIPFRAVHATLMNDYNRVLAGSSPMSNQDAYASMQSAGANQVLTADPSGNGNVMTNIFHDAQGIFTGIFHAPQTLLHEGEGLVAGTRQAFEGKGIGALMSSLGQVAQLVPGVTDAEQLAKGNFSYILQHPLYTALDLAGLGGMAGRVTELATGAVAASHVAADAEREAAIKAGFMVDTPNVRAVPDLSKSDIPLTFANILESTITPKSHPVIGMTARAIHENPTLESTFSRTLGPLGLYGHRIRDLIKPYNILQSLGQSDFAKVTSQLANEAEKLNPDQMRSFYGLLTTHRTVESVVADSTIDPAIKEAYRGWQKLVDDYNAHAEKSGHNVVITNPHTGEQVVVGAQSIAAKLIRNHDTAAAKYLVQFQKQHQIMADADEKLAPLTKPVFNPITGVPLAPGILLNAHDFIQTARQSLSQLDPRNFINLGTGQFSKDSIRNATQRYHALFADDGPVVNLEQALSNPADHDTIKRTMTIVKNRTNSKFYNHVPQFQQIRQFIDQYQKADRLNKGVITRAVSTQAKRTAISANRMMQAGALIDKQWHRVTADNYEQIIAGIMANKLAARARALPMDKDALTNVLDLLNSGELYPTKLQPFLSPREWQLIRRDALAEYDRISEDGGKPMWVPKVTEIDNPGFVRIGADRLPSVASAKSRAMNFSYSIQNPYLGLAKAWEELIARDRTDEFYEKNVLPRLIPANRIQAQAEDEWQLLRQTTSKAPKSFKEYYHHKYANWMNFDPHEFLHQNSRHLAVTDKLPMMIDRADYQLLQYMGRSMNNTLTRSWDNSLNLFRHAVLTISPRFFAHITLGGAFLSLLKTGPKWLTFFPDAHQIITKGEWPTSLSRGLGFGNDVMDRIYQPHQFHEFLGGRSLGRWFAESIGNRLGLDHVQATAEAYHQLLETWSDHYRVMAYLYGKNRAERKGVNLTQDELDDAKKYDLSPTEYEGIKLGNKVLADLNSRTPLERTIIRFAFPFGGWSKHVLRYVLQFPLDHPLRTNFLSNLFEQSYEADTSGLPEYLFHLLFLGHPDSMGNVTAIDFRQWNPLRDVANYLTLGGIISQLNPAVGGLLSAMGINSATGAPELYPQLTYDAFYGGYQVQTPTGNTAMSMVGSFIPEFGVLDHFLKLSSYTQSLARYDPKEFNNQLWQSLNFPWAPQQLNVDQIIAKQETDRLTVLKNDVTNALSQNSMTPLNGLEGPFPYEGWYFSSGQISSIISAANEWSKATGIEVPASALLATPTAPTIPLGITPPVTLAPEQVF